jgi:hypothetical protein
LFFFFYQGKNFSNEEKFIKFKDEGSLSDVFLTSAFLLYPDFAFGFRTLDSSGVFYQEQCVWKKKTVWGWLLNMDETINTALKGKGCNEYTPENAGLEVSKLGMKRK